MNAKTSIAAVASLGLILLAGCGSGGASGLAVDGTSDFEKAKDQCSETSPYITVMDGGSGMAMQGVGTEASGATIDDIVCVLTELGMPQTVASRMDNTRAMDGTLDATWDDIKATWSYHPDDGFSIVLEQS